MIRSFYLRGIWAVNKVSVVENTLRTSKQNCLGTRSSGPHYRRSNCFPHFHNLSFSMIEITVEDS